MNCVQSSVRVPWTVYKVVWEYHELCTKYCESTMNCVQSSVRVPWTVVTCTGSNLAWENNGIAQTVVTLLSVPALGEFLAVFLSVCVFVCQSLWDHHEGRCMKVWFWQSDWDWLRCCANLCLEEIRPVEVLLLQKWRKKLPPSSLYFQCPGEVILDQVGIWNIHPSQKIYIEGWNRKILALGMPTTSLKGRVKHHPFPHCLPRFLRS